MLQNASPAMGWLFVTVNDYRKIKGQVAKEQYGYLAPYSVRYASIFPFIVSSISTLPLTG